MGGIRVDWAELFVGLFSDSLGVGDRDFDVRLLGQLSLEFMFSAEGVGDLAWVRGEPLFDDEIGDFFLLLAMAQG